jgi:hypothetical protein
MKRFVANKYVEGYVVAMLNIRKDFHPMCVHVWNYTSLGYEQSSYWLPLFFYQYVGLRKSIWSYWCPSLTIGWTKTCSRTYCLGCDDLLAGCQNFHLRELINDHEDIVIPMIG